MQGPVRLSVGSRIMRVVVTGVLCVGLVGTASAGEDFFSRLFGGGVEPEAPQYAPAMPEAPVFSRPIERRHSRPLTVRLHRPKIRQLAAATPTAPAGKVTIYDDPTLRRGDAVMTIKGMRIFAGSKNWPYTDRDFVSVVDAGRMDKEIRTTLIALDSAPRQ